MQGSFSSSLKARHAYFTSSWIRAGQWGTDSALRVSEVPEEHPAVPRGAARHKCSRMHSNCQLDFVGAELRAEPIMQLQSLSNNLIPDEMKAANCLGKSLARMLHSLYATAKQHSAPQCQQAPRCDSICLALSQQLLLQIHSISAVQYSKSLSHLYLYGLCRPEKYCKNKMHCLVMALPSAITWTCFVTWQYMLMLLNVACQSTIRIQGQMGIIQDISETVAICTNDN